MAKSYQQNYIQAVIFLISCSAALSCHGTLIASGITADEKRIILQEHNKLRQLVATGGFPGQPAAENMQEVVWDDELAARAQEWANNCEFRHDPKRTIKRFTMGQNLAVIWSTAPLEPDDGDFPSRIKNWFNEVQKYSFGASWSPKTGHYSQLVWGETNLVGCGFSEYKDRSKYNKLYVCNYGPGGNVVGFNPYEVGKPSCKSYGMNPSPYYKGLCRDPSVTPIRAASVNEIQTYEYKQNTFNTKTSYTSSQFNNQQLQQANSQQSQQQQEQPSPFTLLSKSSANIPALVSPYLHQEPLWTKILSHQPEPESTQDTQSQLSIIKNPIGEQSILRAILNPNPITALEMPLQSQLQQEEQVQKEQQHDQDEKHHQQLEEQQLQDQQQQQQHQQQQQQPQQQQQLLQSQVEILEAIPTGMMVQPSSKGGWNLLTWRG